MGLEAVCSRDSKLCHAVPSGCFGWLFVFVESTFFLGTEDEGIVVCAVL